MRSEVGTTNAKHDAHFKETKEKGYASGFRKTGSMTTKRHLFLSAVWWAQETWRSSPPRRSGSSHAFDVLVERHARRILCVAQRVTRSREDAEDVVQQSFQKAFVHLQKFEGRSSFSTWLTRIAINEALMCLRTNHRAHVVSIDELTHG